MKTLLAALFALALAACTAAPVAPRNAADAEAKKFQPLPDKAVVYIVRLPVDSFNTGALSLGNAGSIGTYQGTYYRWEATPGVQRIETVGANMSVVTIDAQPGRIYFVQHRVIGGPRVGVVGAVVQRLDDETGRRMVLASHHQ